MKGPQNTPPQDKPPQDTGGTAGKQQGARFLVDTLGVATRDAAQEGDESIEDVPAPDSPPKAP
ncbi:hypothetical protein [Pelagibacterium lacus]|uniref:Uncharacterized protein n=1 Tax=Pelagibacterium lacus TaxID=2282655 RepID=A0A369W5Z3_9HYPH|nr:hypothetical protein [Pelagibacterium lacus]RDE09439.1 hypothetical protein DVH29_06440 [Pelagibacterium lacus]